MAYINNNNGKLEIISCLPEVATKGGYTLEPKDFKFHPVGKLDADYYNSDYTFKTNDELLDSKIMTDNRGTYYCTETLNKIVINDYNIDKPEKVTELEPPEFAIWDKTKWIQDTVKLAEKEQLEKINDIAMTDSGMVRCIDDLLDYVVNNTPIPQITKDKLDTRKALRGKL